MTNDSLNACPNCKGPADNGHDRCHPPSPYWCTKCMIASNLYPPKPPIDETAFAAARKKVCELEYSHMGHEILRQILQAYEMARAKPSPEPLLDSCRSTFESWYGNSDSDPTTGKKRAAWEAWQAAWNHRDHPAPEPISEEDLRNAFRAHVVDGYGGLALTVNRAVDALKEAGYRVVKSKSSVGADQFREVTNMVKVSEVPLLETKYALNAAMRERRSEIRVTPENGGDANYWKTRYLLLEQKFKRLKETTEPVIDEDWQLIAFTAYYLNRYDNLESEFAANMLHCWKSAIAATKKGE